MPSPSEFPQHERLTRALNIYRSTMRRHIAGQWQEGHGDSWLEALKDRLEEHQRDEMDASQKRLENERMSEKLRLSDDEAWQQLVDIPIFLNAVKNNQAMFGELASDDITHHIYAIYDIRNAWAHPPVKDFTERYVDQAIDHCAQILTVFNKDAAAAIYELFAPSGQLTGSNDSVSHRSIEQQQSAIINLEEKINDLQKLAIGTIIPALDQLSKKIKEQSMTVDNISDRIATSQQPAQPEFDINELRNKIESLSEDVRGVEATAHTIEQILTDLLDPAHVSLDDISR